MNFNKLRSGILTSLIYIGGAVITTYVSEGILVKNRANQIIYLIERYDTNKDGILDKGELEKLIRDNKL